MTLELTGTQFRPLSQALRERLNLDQFDELLKTRLNRNREDIALGNNYQTIVLRVIDEANRAGWVYRLVEAARQERPDEPVFVEYARMLGIGPRGLPPTAELQGIVTKSNTMLNIAVFRERIGQVEGRVCRVDILGEGEGTGFLVGPSAVLTNYHVVESLVKKERGPEDFTCRFDLKVREDNSVVNKGTPVPVVGLLAHSEYDAADLADGVALPDPQNLDYALLQLDGEPGNEPIGGVFIDDKTPPRGWVSMAAPSHAFAAHSPLFIVQHPDKRPMKLALDTEAILGLNGNATRVRYRTNTEPGSSGSPCFSQNWDLVALHHSGDPNWVPTWNEGIPISLVRQHIQDQGCAGSLG